MSVVVVGLELRPKHVEFDEIYRGVDKFLALPGMKQATTTEDFDVHISYL
jgi:hypothetical protein